MKITKLLPIITLCCIVTATADTLYQPYTTSKVEPTEVINKLKNNGFEIAGEYSPYDGTKIIVITSKELQAEAAKSDKGGYGAIIRVAITTNLVSYTTPAYWANAYRMESELTDVATNLEKALGSESTFGSEKGLTKKKLRKYHYMKMMPYFDDQVKLGEFSSHTEAVTTIETALKSEKNGIKAVYKVEITGKDETLFGFSMTGDQEITDKSLMSVLNKFTGNIEHAAFLPYEILVSDKTAYMLHGKFRIALSFPDLSMGQFMKIRNAPSDIKKAAKSLLK